MSPVVSLQVALQQKVVLTKESQSVIVKKYKNLMYIRSWRSTTG